MTMINPYYEEPGITIYHGDCRDILPHLEPVDLVITSPPYNMGNDHHTGNTRHHPYKDDLPEEQYQKEQIFILDKLYQTSKPLASLFYNHKNRIKDGLMISPYEWLFKTNWIRKQEIAWFQRSQNFDKCRFYPMTERIFWLSKEKKTSFYNTINKHDDWHIEPEGITGYHPRSFPIEIPKNIICCFPAGETILDPFMGSGTTLRAAKDLGRKAIGIEIEEKYCAIAVERLRQGVLI